MLGLGLCFWDRVTCLGYMLYVRVRRFDSMLGLNISDQCFGFGFG